MADLSACSKPWCLAINVNHQKPREIVAEEIAVSYSNRDINICHVHNLGKDFETEGYDPTMMKPGCVHRVAHPDNLARLHKHNRGMRTEQRQCWPPYLEGRVWCACLGGNHATLQFSMDFKSPRTTISTCQKTPST